MTNPAKLPMTLRSLRNLFSRPATRLYPHTTRPSFAGARGQLELDADACNFCSLCARRCPTVALCVTTDERRFELDDLRCIACGVCVDVCTRGAIHLTAKAPQVYAARPASAGDTSVGRREWGGQPDTTTSDATESAAAPE